MNTSIFGRHINLTDSIKDYINSSIEAFKKYNLDIIFLWIQSFHKMKTW